MGQADDAHVLYVDHQGHPAPLSMSYHATASRRLASAVDRQPPSTVTEVDSAYCPQCLSFHDANTASNIGYCPKVSCRLCPLCRAVATVSVDEAECFYKCGLCDWASKTCYLVQPVPVDSEGNVAKEDLEAVSEKMGQDLLAKQEQGDHSEEEHYKLMLTSLEDLAKEQIKGQRSTFYSSSASSRRRDTSDAQSWSVSSLEESIDAREKLVTASLFNNVGGGDLQSLSLEVEQVLDSSMKGRTVESVILHANKVSSMDGLLPMRVPLRPRKSRRCRAELAEGRPGILLKPKLNPLEGDSSLRTGHGQWWKKDSSGIHVLPRVQILKHGSNGNKHVLLIETSNPTLGAIRLRLAASKYKGEVVWGSNDETDARLSDLLVDSLTNAVIDAHLVTSAVEQLEATELCELEPAEDSFLEFGKSANEDPSEVIAWNADTALSNHEANEGAKSASLRLLSQKSASAWYELVVAEAADNRGPYTAVPISLQIEVGNGSWETSLIQSTPQEGDDPDVVSFDVVLAWKSMSA